MDQLFREFGEHPGLYFVAATLLPLASFVILLLTGGLRKAFRSFRGTPLGGRLFEMTGGDHCNRGAAYVATGAMALAFLCSLVGGVQHFREEGQALASHHAAAEHGHPAAKEDDKHEAVDESHPDAMAARWSGQLTWLQLHLGAAPATGHAPEPEPATRLSVGYKVDGLTVIMFLMVTFIATLIHVFSAGYMADELADVVDDHHVHTDDGHLRRRGRFGRFFLFLSFFCFSMLNLILADNFFQVFVSWELVGICSYLLVGFYYERQSASNAANKAFITNRVGDAGFILGVLILWTQLGTLNFDKVFEHLRAPQADAHGQPIEFAGRVIRGTLEQSDGGSKFTISQYGDSVLLLPSDPIPDKKDLAATGADGAPTVVAGIAERPGPKTYGSMKYWLLVLAGLGIFLGCVGKSAQFPLHVWLPDAMEGPTPVSALIHAATMVAAGVYLVGRVFPMFVPESRLVIAYTGAITLFMAATIAIVATDIKKVLAYSTVSQLGYMMLALGVGGWVGGLFHLLTHAFFKALLFLCSGAVIYNCHHEQEMTKMGGLFPKMKITAITMLVGVLTIAGTPLLSGWYSKDQIVGQAFGFACVHPQHFLLFILPLGTAGITAFYMFRMWLMTFTGKPRDAHVYEHAHEAPWSMTVPLIILAVATVVVAWPLPEQTAQGGWSWPVHDAEKSHLGQRLHHQMLGHASSSVLADFGGLTDLNEHEHWAGGHTTPPFMMDFKSSERAQALQYQSLSEGLAFGAGVLGILFAFLIYYYRTLDPAEAAEQFPGVYRFLVNKWYVDEFYSAAFVRPALVVGTWCRSFDLKMIDGLIHLLARVVVWVARGEGWFDNGIVDGLVNLVARVVSAIGYQLRSVQTGYLRSYVLFLVLAVIGLFAVVSYFVKLAFAG